MVRAVSVFTKRCLGVVTLWGLLAAPAAAAEPPLHQQIDQLLARDWKAQKIQPAAIAGDAEFVRRVYLDVAGMPPTADECREFLDSKDPNKRSRLIDRLIDDPRFARRMQLYLDEMLMERLPNKSATADDWAKFLYDSLLADKPYDQLVREILTADGADAQQRGAARFILDRDVATDTLVRDVGRVFLGRDMQCAQCHDHPVIYDYEQAHYYGLYSYLSRSFLFTDAKAKKTLVAEKATAEVTFKSVFDPDTTHQAGPHVLDGPVVEEPAFAPGEEYEVAPAKDNSVRPIPKFSLRARLAEDVTATGVSAFPRNMANRLWALMMGRGLFHPLDLDHSDNPPSHPEVLDLLSKQFVAGGFQIRPIVRELALTQVYQRSSQLPPGKTEADLPPESFAAALLKPLSPEQFALSLLQATGGLEQARAAARDALKNNKELAALGEDDPQRQRLAEQLVEQGAYAKVRAEMGPFIATFAESGITGGEFSASAFQALFVANAAPVHTAATTAATALTARFPEDNAALVEELYLRVLSRRPEKDELEATVGYLTEAAAGQPRTESVRDLFWALAASAEFRFNH